MIFYGENEAEHGNPVADNNKSLRDKSYFTFKNLDKIYLGGMKYSDILYKYKLDKKSLDIFLPPKAEDVKIIKLRSII